MRVSARGCSESSYRVRHAKLFSLVLSLASVMPEGTARDTVFSACIPIGFALLLQSYVCGYVMLCRQNSSPPPQQGLCV